MSEKLSETIRIRLGEPLRKKVEKIAVKMSQNLPAGSRRVTIAEVARIALSQYVDNGK